ncbi:MAG: hypothetical protein ABSA45_12625 [Verrucomicrobiota bacterium]|jgi:hypothetical protein
MKSKFLKSEANQFAIAICGVIFALQLEGRADVSFTLTNTTADAFLASGSAGNPAGANLTANNYGGGGTLAIAPASSVKGEFDSVIKFNTTGAVSQFNLTYGAGNWAISGLTLSLASNTGTNGAPPGNTIFNTVSGGNFGMRWLSYDTWVEGTGNPQSPSPTGVNFNLISTLLAGSDSLGTYTYTPPGNNVYASYSLPLDANFVSDAAAGGDVSLYFFAADSQISYLFNSRSFASGHPELTLTATPLPEPSAMSWVAVSLGGFWWLRGRKRKA